jgi:hypothetical protein
MSHGYSLYSYIKQTKMSFFPTKSENRRAEQVLSGRLVAVGRGGGGKDVESEHGANTVYTYV